ncbi:MAG: hypothetical protein COV72_08270 [Candidatus Omnitrophica bacterium CG11_big_fil_rev_8_21_14_0_20_42_13]|uniref:histidine kinase n=1 Tax=Candidatus Ghiorseimicrobium undicola TaxID=1974746 RepID=A0A2H0LY81_9BACT|nr:MAG: hypothetical protein COV72_08270 [Candidatus Omnitrophica bacterium CG11_big_fil_rev_8_21_14_0_20_42_13]
MIKRRILVVDDNPNERAAVERVLLRSGYEVIQATSGREALLILNQRKIDCVLLDHLMPDMDGLEVARQIKKDERLKIIPVIMLTGRDKEDDVLAAVNAGADDYIVKTSEPDLLLLRIEAMLRLGRLQRELYDKNSLLDKANSDLHKLDMLKSEFVSTVSHELRTPLSITREGLNLVLEEVTGSLNKQQKELLEVAKNNIDRLGKIISDILDISKIEAGNFPIHKSLVSINRLLQKTFLFFKQRAEQKGIEITLNMPKTEIAAYVDGERIAQVLSNLLNNAVKFTSEGGRIIIGLNEGERDIVCFVEDTGIGIADTDLDKVFTKFQQFSKSYGPGEKGTGLGLSIAKKIVNMHEGRIWVESQLGKGTRLSFSIPKYSIQEIISSHIRTAIRNAEDKMSKFSLLIVQAAGVEKEALFNDIEANIKITLRRSGDSVFSYNNKIIIPLLDTDRNGAQIVKKRVSELCQKYISGDKRFKNSAFTYSILVYPDDNTSEDIFIKKIVG